MSKSGVIEGVAESKDISFADLKEGLLKLKEMNISKPAWRNSFSVDTNRAENTITYKAIENKIPVRSVQIRMDETFNKVLKLKIFSSTTTNLYNLARMVEYDPAGKAEITFIQDVAVMDQQNGWIRLTF